MTLKLTNRATTVLAASIGTGATALAVQASTGAKFPSLSPGDWFPLVVVAADGSYEIMRATARSGDVITVTREQEGTTAIAFNAGARVDLRLTEAAIADIITDLETPFSNFRSDISGAIATGGTSTAYTVTSFQVFDTLANMNGEMVAFTPHATNAAGPVTLSVDGLTARPLRFSPSGVDLPAGTLVQGTPYVATYFHSTSEWILQGLAGNPYAIPLGGMLEFTGTTAPNGSFILPFGQAISRTTYATYFAMVGTTYGVGDGSTTFNVIDKRGRVSAGKDDMGGSGAGRITSAGQAGINGAALGAAGGAQDNLLSTAKLPAHTHTGTTGTESNLHTHGYGQPPGGGFSGGGGGASSGGGGTQTSTQSLTHTHSFTTDSSGGGEFHNNTQPTIIVNYILRVL